MRTSRAYKILLFNRNSLSTWAQQWQKSIIAQGYTIDYAKLLLIDNTIFKPALANGNIYTELDRFNLYAGLVGNENAARVDTMRNIAVTKVSSPTFDKYGYKSSGTSYLKLNYNPSVNGVKLTLNNLNHGYMVFAPPFAGSVRAMGARNVIATNSRLSHLRDNTPQTQAFNNDISGAVNTNTSSVGWVAVYGKRTNPNTENFSIINNNTQTVNRASTVLPNSDTAELTEFTDAGVPTGSYDTTSHGASWHGSSNLDTVKLIQLLRNYFLAVGAV